MLLDITEQVKKQCGFNAATASEFRYVGSERPNLHHTQFLFGSIRKSVL
jgi:hypothetical protein